MSQTKQKFSLCIAFSSSGWCLVLRVGRLASVVLCVLTCPALAQLYHQRASLTFEIAPLEPLNGSSIWDTDEHGRHPPGQPLQQQPGVATASLFPASQSARLPRFPFSVYHGQLSTSTTRSSFFLWKYPTGSSPPTRFAVLLHVEDLTQSPFPSASDAFDPLIPDPLRNMIDPEILSWQATALSVVPFLVWIASLDDQALQFPAYHLRPPYSLAILGNVASSGLNDDRTRRIARGLAVAQVRGTLSDTLHYDVYTGIIPGDYADTLVSGARIGYTFGTSGLTLGVNYGYTLRDTRRQTLERLAGRPGNLANNTYYRLFGVDLLYDKGNLSLAQRIVYGVDADEGRSLAVFTQPALRLNQQWTIFYRFDYLSFGQGMPKSVEHVMGAKFLSTAYLRFKAEFMVQEVNDPPIEGWGFRLVATVQF